MIEWMDGWKDDWMDEWIDEWIDEYIYGKNEWMKKHFGFSDSDTLSLVIFNF